MVRFGIIIYLWRSIYDDYDEVNKAVETLQLSSVNNLCSF